MDRAASNDKFAGARVLITSGPYRGREGVCLGRLRDEIWAVSPDGTGEIVHLRFEDEFSLLVDLSANPARN